MTYSGETLFDLGERRILREIIPRYVDGAGDDCASVILESKQLVITTDPVPRPAALVIGHDDDPFWIGWLLTTINASDIAASGARPSGFLAALDLPRDYPVASFERLLQGISSSCQANGLRYIGGNIREAKELTGVGTAFGTCAGTPLGRRGAHVGDYVIVLGTGGRFWFDALNIRAGKHVEKKTSPVFSPIAQAKLVHHLHEAGLIVCAMDTSDGLAPTLEELALVNDLKIEVDTQLMREASVFAECAPFSERFWFGWGDWTVVAAVSPTSLASLAEKMRALDAPWTNIGRFVQAKAGVELVNGSNRITAQRLESERFAPDSWFTQGIDEYVRRLEAFPLP